MSVHVSTNTNFSDTKRTLIFLEELSGQTTLGIYAELRKALTGRTQPDAIGYLFAQYLSGEGEVYERLTGEPLVPKHPTIFQDLFEGKVTMDELLGGRHDKGTG